MDQSTLTKDLNNKERKKDRLNLGSLLVVYNDQAFLDGLSAILKDEFNIYTSKSSLEALKLIEENEKIEKSKSKKNELRFFKKKFDLIILSSSFYSNNSFDKKLIERIKKEDKIVIFDSIIHEDKILKFLNDESNIVDFFLVKRKEDVSKKDILTFILKIKHRLKNKGILYLNNEIYLDYEAKIAKINGKNIDLTYSEFLIFHFLCTHPNTTYSSNEIYSYIFNEPSLNLRTSVSRHLSSIRKKLNRLTKKEYIKTDFGKGYFFSFNNDFLLDKKLPEGGGYKNLIFNILRIFDLLINKNKRIYVAYFYL